MNIKALVWQSLSREQRLYLLRAVSEYQKSLGIFR